MSPREAILSRVGRLNFEDLKYFLAVADVSSVRKAALKAGVSPATLSRAIKNLQDELNVSLFNKIGRNIELNGYGEHLQARAREIVQQTESLKHEIAFSHAVKELRISGRSVILGHFGRLLVQQWSQEISNTNFIFMAQDGESTLKAVRERLTDFGLTSQQPGPDFLSKKVGEFKMVTFMGPHHPLRKIMRAKGHVSVKEMARYPFVAPAIPIFGRTQGKKSPDGWRDDIFPRWIKYVTDDLTVMEALVESSEALAYLPEYRGRRGLEPLTVSDCDYECRFKIFLSIRRGRVPPFVEKAFATQVRNLETTQD